MATLLTNQVKDIEAHCQSTKLTISSYQLQRKWKVQAELNISNQVVIKRKPLYKLTQRVELGNHRDIIKFSNNESQILICSYGQINQFDFVRNKVKISSQVTLLARQQVIFYLCQNKDETLLVAVCSEYAIIYHKHSATGTWKQQQILHTLLDDGGTHATFSDDSRTLAIAEQIESKLIIHSNCRGKWRLYIIIRLNQLLIDIFYTIDNSFVIVSLRDITIYDHPNYRKHQTLNLREIPWFIPYCLFQINKQLNTIIQAHGYSIQILKFDVLTKQWSKQKLINHHIEKITIFTFNADSSMVLSMSNDLLQVFVYDSLICKWKLHQKIRQVGRQSMDMIVSYDFTTILTILGGVFSVQTLEDIK